MEQHEPIGYVSLDTLGAPPVFVARLAKGVFFAPPHEPHRHDFHEILWVRSGRGRHSVDGRSFALVPHTLSLISRGQVHVFEESLDLNGFYVRFTDDFLSHDPYPFEGNRSPLLSRLSSCGALSVHPSEAASVETLFGLISSEYVRGEETGKYAILRHLMMVLLLAIERARREGRDDDGDLAASYGLYRGFIDELERSYAKHHDVAHYARALHLTPVQLSKLLQRMVGKPTKRVILERVLLEARRYLRFTGLSVKEIATLLGYNDPFHFSKVFKQETGDAPQPYRTKWRKLT